MKRREYEKELGKLQVRLCHLQAWVKEKGLRVVIVVEGRDGAGKGGTIRALTERVSPRVFRVVALPAPSDREKSQVYFQRYLAHFPAAGEIVIFDRSWYNRAGVEYVMGFCTKEQHERFLDLCPEIENYLVSGGVILIKLWLEVSNETQKERFEARVVDPLRQWKLSPMDLPSRQRWYDYSRARDMMLKATDTKKAPWHIVRSDDKRAARLNTIAHILSAIPHKTLPHKLVKLPARSAKGAYNDAKTIAKRRFVKERVLAMNAKEAERLKESRDGRVPWRKWGPYLSERQWGTVREDYSPSGDAWNYFTHDHARSRAYRWGEDGIAGISDDQQLLCFGLALWNGQDPILKERMFGLTNSEGNHGEDVKEYYFYLDSTPTHSYMKYLYKYPHAAFPYDDIVRTNAQRSKLQHEYELLDTGVFNGGRYCDVFVEYAKAGPEDILIQITAVNRGPEPATLHLLPTLWFRNTWSWNPRDPMEARPEVRLLGEGPTIVASHPQLGLRYLHVDGPATLLFTENETNAERIHDRPSRTPYVKDAFHNYLVHGRRDAVNPAGTGTKVAAHHALTIPAAGARVVRLRLSESMAPDPTAGSFDSIIDARRREADEFYAGVIPASVGPDGTNVMRQALAGMLWTKQFYNYDVDRWLSERGSDPFKPHRPAPRNDRWHHMHNADIISMPDKWEYPWYAAWDLAFHVLALTLVDPDFGKGQLDLMLRERYIHPSGQLPAYEWNFGDVNPPVHAWATIFTFRLEKNRRGGGDLEWLERSFHKLLLNFTWWVNRKDRTGNNVFEGGFLGLDNIGVFDRSSPLPTGGYLEQADGTAWMALFCQNMLEISAELALKYPAYADMSIKFIAHYLWIASSLVRAGDDVGMWDEEDGFFYDVLRYPDGRAERLKVRSMVGLLPLCAATVFDGSLFAKYPDYVPKIRQYLDARPELTDFIHNPAAPGQQGRMLASVLNETKLRRVLTRMLDESEFLSEYGIRSISKYHEAHPYVFTTAQQQYTVAYLPAESDSGMFGGNSNWRGPIWIPVNGLIIRALLQYYLYYGDSFVIECPTGSGNIMTLYQVAEEISRRLSNIFLRNADGRRPVYGEAQTFQEDPHWRDLLLFYEYFHGDNGAGVGASHQTGWTGVVARMMHLFATVPAADLLKNGKVVPAKESHAGSAGTHR